MDMDLHNFGYLARLMVRLTIGAAQVDEATRQRHAEYVVSRQRSDGGWAGREGESDLYYTSFALRTLAILGLLEGDIAERSGRFLVSRTRSQETIVDLLSLVYSAKLIEAACDLNPLSEVDRGWSDRLYELLTSLHRDDGGFSKSFAGQAGSTYQTFLVLLCLELIEQRCPNPEAVYRFLINQRQNDGGFLEIRVAKRSGTNPTAAAIGALRVLGKLETEVVDAAAEFLLDSQSDEGGFCANSRIPFPDLLSTFTACVTLADLNYLDRIDHPSACRYMRGMEKAQGGFRGFEFDQADDVEYAFYGLGSLALLNSI